MNVPKNSLIKVVQDKNNYLVHIHFQDKERAKKIVGRQWDGERKAWVYPKDLLTYNSLVEEFQKDADIFDIHPPEVDKKPVSKHIDANNLDNLSVNDDEGSQEKIGDQLNLIPEIFESIQELTSTQNLLMEQFCAQNTEINKALKNIASSSTQAVKETVKIEKIETLPETLNLNILKERKLFEKVLIDIAYEASRKNESFHKWVELHPPMREPSDFVNATHEKIKQQLEQIVNETDPKEKFYNLIKRAQDNNLIYIEPNDPIKVYSILHTLNDIRNRFAHPQGKFHPFEKLTRSIIYLMSLSLIWSRIMIEDSGHE
jgi:hypothetical protein